VSDFIKVNPGFSNQKPPSRKGLWSAVVGFLVLSTVFSLATIYLLNTPPAHFPTDVNLVVTEGMGVKEIAETLRSQGYIHSEFFFLATVMIHFDPTDIKAGTYRFNIPLSPRALAYELVAGNSKYSLVRLTLPEGERARQMATRAAAVLDNFSAAEFVAIAEPHEGRLFPDTYLIPPDFTPEQLLNLLKTTFEERMQPLESKFNNHKLTKAEVITLASIVEREANTPESMALVSGILQNRLAINMKLQADASIEYVLDKPLSELTPEDLRIDSPYNTYTNFGLPPTPIGNPGMKSILAVLEPQPSNYYFYITDETGTFHYARTFAEHRVNIERYLR